MYGNLVDHYTALSKEIVRHELEIEGDEFERQIKCGVFNKYIHKLRQKCLDVLLQSNSESDYEDPCRTSYGTNWNPLILLMDYGGELANYGCERDSEKLYASIHILQGKSYKCLREMFKLMFILRGSGVRHENERQLDFFNTVSEYNLKSGYSFSLILNDLLGFNEDKILASKSLYTECSASIFESGCQLLKKLSNKSISEKISNRHLASASTSKIIALSRSSVSSDFAIKKKSCSSNSFIQTASNLCSSNHSLWDNFVEKPISIKLTCAKSSTENIAYLAKGTGGSGEHIKNKYNLITTHNLDNSTKQKNFWTEIYDLEENSILRDDGNFKSNEVLDLSDSYLYPISKENRLKLQNYESCFGKKFKPQMKKYENSVKNSFFQSPATLILALWEQEYKFRCTYNIESLSPHPDLVVLELDQFLKVVQFLLVGIKTDTFDIDEKKMAFTMKEGTCLEGVTPNTLLSFSKEYIEMGSCYLKLNHCLNLNLRKQMTSGIKDCRIIFKVFWMSVYEYLCRHSHCILNIPVSLGLLEFKACVRNLYPIITAVADVCKVCEPQSVLPQGGQLLTYLLQVIQKISNKCAAGVCFGFLKSCCEIYLVQLLQEWMFQGHLGRHHQDFFVEHRPKNPRCKDRSYYLSFYLFNDRIPSFLKGLENKVFNCGKTIHLLKLIKPESKLCRLLETRSYPRMKLCLTKRELHEQHRNFEEYSKNVSKICGEFASIASLKQEEINRQYSYEKYVIKIKEEQKIKEENVKKVTAEELRLKREEQNQWLKKQMELAAQEKKKKKEEEEKETKLFLQKVKLIAEEEKRIIEEEKLNMKIYYEELLDQIEKRKSEAISSKQLMRELNQKKTMPRNYKSNEEFSVDLTNRSNENITMDSEGNIIDYKNVFTKSELDIANSNVSPLALDPKIEDIQNENILNTHETDLELQALVASRREYSNQIKSEIVSLSPEPDIENLKSPQIDNDSPKIVTIYELGALTAKKHSKVYESNVQNDPKVVEDIAFECGNIETDTEKEGKKIPIAKIEAQKNKEKFITSEYRIQVESDKIAGEKPAVIPVIEAEAQKNKRKLMESEYYLTFKNNNDKEEKPRSPLVETEAQKNRKKIMSTEFHVITKSNEPEGIEISKPSCPETDAQKYKKRTMECEYNLVHCNSYTNHTETSKNSKFLEETEAQKNKKKIMSSEFAIQLESEENEISVKVTVPTIETEAQKNKKKILACEFGYSEEDVVYARKKCKTVRSTKAQKNKQKYLENELGYPKQTEMTQNEDKKEEGKAEELEISSREQDYYAQLDIVEQKDPEYDTGLGNNDTYSSFAEKALQIYNKRRGGCDDPVFFSLNEKISSEIFRNDLPVLNYSEVQILFEKNLERSLVNSDPNAVGTDLVDMDVTTFMNCIRKSVLIPLQIQEKIANEALFVHLLKEENMLSHFNALRNYFFLNDGEFSRRLTQNIFMTLAKCTEPQQFFKRSTLNEIVYEALNYTIHCNEPNAQNVSFEIVKMPEYLSHSSHDVLLPFDLSYQVKWPLNIILTEKALSKYKLVFHFLLKLKRINWTLNENFSYLTHSCRDKNISSRLLVNSPHYHKIHIYRHAMGQFMRTLENYTSSCSLQFSWLNFQKDLESAKNLDHFYEKHVRYIKDVLKLCFLTKECQELVNCINSLIELSLKFHYATKSGKWILNNRKYEHTKFDVLKATFSEFCSSTTEFLKTLRKKINYYHDLKPHEVLMEKFDLILR